MLFRGVVDGFLEPSRRSAKSLDLARLSRENRAGLLSNREWAYEVLSRITQSDLILRDVRRRRRFSLNRHDAVPNRWIWCACTDFDELKEMRCRHWRETLIDKKINNVVSRL